jgi:hypothetical protein
MSIMAELPWNAVRFDPERRGHVESYFFKLNDSEGRRALWLKATILSRRSGTGPVAEAWAIAFDREEEHVAAKEVVAYESARFSREGLSVKVENLRFEEGRIEGSVASADHRIEFALEFSTDKAPLVPYPSRRMYQGRLPSSKLVSPHPDSRFSGRYSVDGRAVEVEGWRGMQGHNWGTKHAELYGWGHCNQWCEDEELVVEGVTARVKLGRILTPPITIVCAIHRGVRYAFNRPSQLLLARGSVTERSWRFRATAPGARIEGELAADTRDFAGLYYENPNGEMTYCLNSKIARGSVRLEIEGRAPVVVTTRTAALEIGTKHPEHGVHMVA